jgi:hypothetical protein
MSLLHNIQNISRVITTIIHTHPEIYCNSIIKSELIYSTHNSLNEINTYIVNMEKKIKKLELDIEKMKNTKCKNNWSDYY